MGDPETHRSKKKSKTWAWREIVELRERKRKKEREMEVYGSCAVKGKEDEIAEKASVCMCMNE